MIDAARPGEPIAAAACLAVTLSAGVLVSGLDARRHATTGGGDQRPTGFSTLYRLDAADGRVRGRLQLDRAAESLAVDPSQRSVMSSRLMSSATHLPGRVRTGRELARLNLRTSSLASGVSPWVVEVDGHNVATVHRLDPQAG